MIEEHKLQYGLWFMPDGKLITPAGDGLTPSGAESIVEQGGLWFDNKQSLSDYLYLFREKRHERQEKTKDRRRRKDRTRR